jgi:hypothetical protein
LIQDYEPGFYSWSTLFALAETTYRSLHRTIAVFNTDILKKYFEGLGYRFYRTYSFKPAINRSLLEGLQQSKNMLTDARINYRIRMNTYLQATGRYETE